jgi:2-methylcitrate dehydratase PrpD
MSAVPKTVSEISPLQVPLAARMARSIVSCTFDNLSADIVAKVKICLFDFIGCAFESRALPWSKQAISMAQSVAENQGAAIIGNAQYATFGDAAFANAVMGHGLVREDMHSGSISHLGIVVFPTLLALSQSKPVIGKDFINAAVVGYEAGGQIGRAIMDAEIAKIHRPTGVTGPIAAAAAGARLMGLNIDATTSAIALGANTTLGFNQWAHTGGSEMFFQAGFAARNALSAVHLAAVGAFASPSALDGEAGLFASFNKRSAADKVDLFGAQAEILSVYHKPVPACNFAQTPCQAALRLAREEKISPDQIASIKVRVPRAGKLYPGCDHSGPFEHILQAKMSIQYNVAAALMLGGVSENNFTLLNDAALHRLISKITLEIDDEMTGAYPALQGGAVAVTMADSTTRNVCLTNVVNAGEDEVRARFRVATVIAIGSTRAHALETFIDNLEHQRDVGAIGALFRSA